MRLGQLAGAAISLWLVSTTVLAQPAAAPPPDPERLRLAREVMVSIGGVEGAQARLKAIFGTMTSMVKSNLGANADASGLADSLMTYMVDEEMKAVPEMVDQTAVIYAQHMSVSELKDMLAWNNSASARSIREKMPQITQELMMQQGPLMKRMTSGAVKKAVERTCEQSHCTADQRQALNAIAEKVAPST